MVASKAAARARAEKARKGKAKFPDGKRKVSRERQRRRKKIEGGAGVIRRGETYHLAVFQELADMGDCALRRAERDGLNVIAVGNARYVTGDDFHDFIASQKSKKAGAQ